MSRPRRDRSPASRSPARSTSARTVRFGDEAQLVGEVFATHAALALAGARHSRQLNEALASRDAIGQAKGLLAPALCPPPYKPERVRTAIGTRGHRSLHPSKPRRASTDLNHPRPAPASGSGVMAQQNLTAQQAFDLLVRASQESNLKLTDVATWLIEDHEHPEEANRPHVR